MVQVQILLLDLPCTLAKHLRCASVSLSVNGDDIAEIFYFVFYEDKMRSGCRSLIMLVIMIFAVTTQCDGQGPGSRVKIAGSKP